MEGETEFEIQPPDVSIADRFNQAGGGNLEADVGLLDLISTKGNKFQFPRSVPEEWAKLFASLPLPERRLVSRYIKAVSRGYSTVGELRSASIRDLELQRNCSRKGAIFLQDTFRLKSSSK